MRFSFDPRMVLTVVGMILFGVCTSTASAQPANDDCIDAIPVNEGVFPFDNTGASLDGPIDADPNMNSDVWFLYTATVSTLVTIETCSPLGSLDDTVLIVYDGSSCPTPGSPFLETDDDGCVSPNFNSSVQLPATAGNSYLIQVGGWGTVQGDATLSIYPPNEVCGNGADDDGDGLVDCFDPDCGANAACAFVRGDADGNTTLTVEDFIPALQVLMLQIVPVPPLDRYDTNDNGVLEISDVSYLSRFIFAGGPTPPAPFPVPGTDTTPASFPVVPDPGLELEVSPGATCCGNSVTVPVVIRTDGPVDAVQFRIVYDPALLTFDGGTDITAASGIPADSASIHEEAPGIVRGVFLFDISGTPIPAQPSAGVAELQFTVSPNAARGVPIPVRFEDDPDALVPGHQLFAVAGEAVIASTTDGSITPDCSGADYALAISGPSQYLTNPFETTVLLDNNTANEVQGGSYGVCHDSAVFQIDSVELSPTLETANGGGPLDFGEASLGSGGYNFGFVVSFTGSAGLPPGNDLPLTIATYTPLGAAGTTTMSLCNTIGVPPVGVDILVGGLSFTPATCGLTLSEGDAEICDNGLDDDTDGLADCEDPDCAADLACVVTGTADECVDAETIIAGFGTTSFPIDNTTATTGSDPVDATQCDVASIGTFEKDIWYRWVPMVEGLAQISTCGLVTWDSEIEVYNDGCGILTPIACNGDGAGCPDFSSLVDPFQVFAGVEYLIRVGGWDTTASGTGTIEVALEPLPPILDLVCTTNPVDATILVTWTNAVASDLVEVLVDGTVVYSDGPVGPGSAGSYTTDPLATGLATITVRGTQAGVAGEDFCVGYISGPCAPPEQTLSPTFGATTPQTGLISCNAGGIHAQNTYWRTFELCAPPYSLAEQLRLTCFNIGIDVALSPIGTQPVVIRVYSDPGGGSPSPIADLIPLYAEQFEVVNVTDTLYQFVPGTGTLLEGDPDLPCIGVGGTIVVAFELPDGGPDGNSLFPSGPSSGSSEVSPTYISAPACGLAEPATLDSIGLSGQIILDVGFESLGVCPCGDGIFGLQCDQSPGTTDVQLSWIGSGPVDTIEVVDLAGGLLATLAGTETSYLVPSLTVRDTRTFVITAFDGGGAQLNSQQCTIGVSPPNNWAEGAVALPPCDQTLSVDIDSFVRTTGEVLDGGLCAELAGFQVWNDLWYCWPATADGSVVVSACNGDAVDTRLAVYSVCGAEDPLALIACNDTGSSCGTTGARLSFTAVAGAPYLIRLGTDNAADFGTTPLDIVAVNAPPVVVGAPSGTIVVEADSANPLDVSFDIAAPETCQNVSYSLFDPAGAVANGLQITATPTGSSRTISISWSPDCASDLGSYYLEFTVFDDHPTEPLSTTIGFTIAVEDTSCPPPDLVVTGVSVPSELAIDSTTTVSWTLKNIGSGSADGPWTERVYASTNGTLDASDEFLASQTFSGTLAPGQATGRSLVIPAPQSIPQGPITLFVCTDTDPEPDGAVEESDETNNCSGFPVVLGAVDLTLQDVVAPSLLAAGLGGDFTASVLNLGTVSILGTSVTIHLSSDTILDAGDTEVLTYGVGAIGPGGVSVDGGFVEIPPGTPPGPYHWIFEVDGLGQNPESNEGNNTLSLPVQVGTIDLELLSISPPVNPVPGNPETVSWVVRNNGTVPVPANASPFDTVWVNTTGGGYGPGTPSEDFVWASAPTGLIAPGEIVVRNLTATFPSVPSGDNFIRVCIDYTGLLGTDGVLPETDEMNNCGLETICVDCLHPDLRVTATPALAAADDGDLVQVSYSVVNEGTADAEGNWTDRVYLSSDTTLDPGTDFLLSDSTENERLPFDAPGNDYTRSPFVTIPSGIQGDYFFIVQTDATGSIVEPGAEDDNVLVAASPTTISQPNLPDLTLNILTTTSTVFVDTVLPLSWLVTNLTPDGYANATWTDRVYLSPDATLEPGTDLLLAETMYSGLLNPGQSYIRNMNMLITEPAGSYFVLYVTDADDVVPETDELNLVAQPITIAAAPDLALLPFSLPASATLGEPITVNWTVENRGSAAAAAPWIDRVYISDNSTFDTGDTVVGSESRLAPLDPGFSYGASLTFPAPELPGLYWVVIETDGTDQVDEAVDVELNRRIVGPIDVFSLTPPNLRVTSIVPIGPACGNPTSLSSGDPISVQYTVVNDGIDPAVGIWTDAVRLSTDATIDNGDPTIGSGVFQGSLPPGGTYSRNVTVVLPEDAPGCYWVGVQTDSAGAGGIGGVHDITEVDETDNVTTSANFEVELAPQPDLVVTQATYNPTTFAGQAFVLEYSVANLGDAPTDTGTWVERAYFVDLSTGQNIGTSFDLFSRQGPTLPPGVTDGTRAAIGTVPIGFSGCYGIRVELDTTNQITEVGNEANNAILMSDLPTPVPGVVCGDGELEVTPVVPLDLSVAPGSIFTSTASLARGGVSSVTYDIWNGGGPVEDALGAPMTFAQTWIDEIHYSTDDLLDAGDRFLTSLNLANQLDALNEPTLIGVYPRTKPFPIPSDLPVGPGFLLISLNANAGLVETDFTDNLGTFAIPIVVDAPDLVANIDPGSNVADAAIGEAVTVTWTVTNTNPAPTGADEWRDRIYLDAPGGSTLIKDSMHQGVLAGFASYTRTDVVTIPVATPGPATIRVVTDLDGLVFEEGATANNTAELPITLRSDAADLVLDGPPVPATTIVNAGQPLTVTWTVRNQDAFPPNVSNWRDRAYLSTDQTLSADDRFLGERTRAGGLAPGTTYERSASFTVPVDIQGNRFLIVRTDGLNAVFESDETNNDGVSTQIITIAPVLPPNLVVTDVTTPAIAFAGQEFPVDWTITNAGSGNVLAQRWWDGVYLSTDTSLQSGTDIFIGRHEYRFDQSMDSPPTAGASVSTSEAFDLPADISGDFFVLVRTDLYNAVPELGGEIDNVGTTAIPVTIVIPDPANLVVETIGIPTSVAMGQALPIQWEVRNLDNPTEPVAAVQGRWSDTIVLSLDDQLDESDHPLRTYISGQTNVEFPAGALTVRNEFPNVPPVPPGDYRVLVITDSADQVPETDEQNSFASVGTVSVQAIDVAEGSPFVDTLPAGAFRVYRLDTAGASPGDTIEITFDHVNSLAWTEVYASFSSVPTSSSFDLASGLPTQPSQLLRIPDIGAGEYFVLVRVSGNTEFGTSATFEWNILAPEIELATPAVVGNEGRVTIRFDGAGFLPELANDPANVRLDDLAGNVYFPRRLERIDSTRFVAEFEFDDAVLGTYDVITQNGSAGATSAPGLVTIEPLAPPMLTLDAEQEATFRSGEVGTVGTTVTNVGNVDAPFVILSHRTERILDRAWLASRSTAHATFAQELFGIITETALVRSLSPGGTIDLESDIRLEVLPQVGEEVPPGEFVIQRGAAILGLEEFIERMESAAEEIRLTLLADPSLVPEPTFVALQAELVDPVAWRDRWFDELVAADLFDPLDLGVGGVAPSPAVGGDLCTTTSLFPATVGDCFVNHALVQGTAFVTSPPDEVLVALECQVEDLWDPTQCDSIEIRAAIDPNEKNGPEGFGSEGFVGFQKAIPYTIYFENTADVSLGSPASRVLVVDPLPEVLIAESVRLGTISLPNRTVAIPDDRIFYQARVDLVAERGVLLDITAGVNIERREVFWIFQSIDPVTGFPPVSGDLGFLPPSDGMGSGSGSVSFEVRPVVSSSSGPEQIDNRSTITFDTAAPLLTNTATNKLDGRTPTSDMEATSMLGGSPSVLLTWAGSDPPDESGLESYTLYAAPEGQTPMPILQRTTQTSYVFTGEPGITYDLWIIARDYAGNIEDLDPDNPKASFTAAGTPPTITLDPISDVVCVGEPITLEVQADGTGPLTYRWLRNGMEVPGATEPILTIAAGQVGDAGTYTAEVSNVLGTAASAPAVVDVLEPPTITAPPTGETLCDGGSTTLSVIATGVGTLTYQWLIDSAPIPGAMSSTLELGPVGPADDGAYSVAVTNSCGTTTTTPVVLTVLGPVVLTGGPDPTTVCLGAPFTLEVTFDGSAPVTVQWTRDGVPIPGATDPQYSVASATIADAADHTAIVTNDCNSVESPAATVTVRAGPTIVTQPVPVVTCVGTNAQFSVGATGSAPLFYAWFRDGAPLGISTPVLDLSNVSAGDAGVYTVTISNDCGILTSAGASLTVQEPVSIVASPAGADLCEGQPLSLSVTATGTAPLAYQWFRDGSPIPGAIAAAYSVATVGTGDAGAYRVDVTNPCGTVSSADAVVTVDVAPTVTTQPTGGTLCEGDPLSLSMTATGSTPIAHQWFLDGAPIAGATGSSYTVAAVAGGDAGTYTVELSNVCGSATSDAAVITVDVPPTIVQGPNDLSLCVGDALSLSVIATGSPTLTYQWFLDGVPIPGAVQADYAVAAVGLPDFGTYRVDVTNDCGTATATAVITAADTITIGTPPAGADLCLGEPLVLAVSATGTAPLTYQWIRDGAPIPGATDDTYSVAAVDSGDAGSYRVTISNPCGSITSPDAIVTVGDDPTIISGPADTSVCPGAPLDLAVDATGVGALAYEWLLDGAPIPGATQAQYSVPSFGPTDAGTYTVVVTSPCGSASANAVVTAAVPVGIDVPPLGADLCAGEALVLTVVPSGTGPFEYQWNLDGAPIPGAESGTYAVAAVGPADAGSYAVEITNVCGSATSVPVGVTVGVPAAIVALSGDQTLCVGDDLTLEVTIDGDPFPSVQWSFEGIPLPGATSSTLSIPNVNIGESGPYTVTVTNPCGSVTSGPIDVEVLEPPFVFESPTGVAVCAGEPFTLTVGASGGAPLSVQWSLDGIEIPGATGTEYSVVSAGPSDAGVYRADVTNACGTVGSADAPVVVNTAPTIITPPLPLVLCSGDPWTLTVDADGTLPLEYQWSLDGVPIPGANATSYGGSSADPSVAGVYSVAVTNICGTTSASAAVSVGTPPSIIANPVDQVACPGQLVQFTVVADGTTPFSYQWLLDGSPIVDATAAMLVLPVVDLVDEGTYSVEIANGCGVVVSDPATLTIETSVAACDCNGNGVLDETDIADGTSPDVDGDGIPDECQLVFVRGDANDDGMVDISDAISSLLYVSGVGFVPCAATTDVNDDAMVNIADPISLLAALFSGGPAPGAPFPDCGLDPTPVALPCDVYLSCP